MGCKTCAKLPLFGWMIARSDGDSLRRVLDADSSARIMYISPAAAAAAAAAAAEAHHFRYTSAHRPPSVLAIDSSGCARQVSHKDTHNCPQLRTYAAFADWSRDGMGEHRTGGEVQSRMQTPRPSHSLSHSTGTPRAGITARWLMGGATRWPCCPPRSSCRCCIRLYLFGVVVVVVVVIMVMAMILLHCCLLKLSYLSCRTAVLTPCSMLPSNATRTRQSTLLPRLPATSLSSACSRRLHQTAAIAAHTCSPSCCVRP